MSVVTLGMFRVWNEGTQPAGTATVGGSAFGAGSVVQGCRPGLPWVLIGTPAAVAAAQVPIRTQGNPGLHPCTTDPAPNADPPIVEVPAGCVPSFQTLNIPNVTTDIGLSPVS